ncbi:hypothetical protein ACU686_38540 [Yinghuangia aomiensis]
MHAAPRGLGGDSVVLSDGTVLGLSATGTAVRELGQALDRFAEVTLTRVRAARDGFQLTFHIEGLPPVQASANSSRSAAPTSDAPASGPGARRHSAEPLPLPHRTGAGGSARVAVARP